MRLRCCIDRALMVLEGFHLMKTFQEQGNCFLRDIPRGSSRIPSPSHVATSMERHVLVAKLDVRLWSTWSSNVLPPSWHNFLLFSIKLRPVRRFRKEFRVFECPGAEKKHLKSTLDSTTTDGIWTFESRILKR